LTVTANPQFRAGDRVFLRSERSRVGIVADEPRRAQGLYWYRIRFVDGTVDLICEEDLEAFNERLTPEDLFAQSSFGDRDDLLRTVTFRKLDTPLDNTLYALGASRTEFYPHQYKPLIKLLDSRNQRLLIADEVGLGKTIEAGLIMLELRARKALNAVLVVCPSSLREKWREEMWRRFELDFKILSAQDLRNTLEVLQERGNIGEFFGIISLQSVRREEIIELLEVAPLPLDLVVFDEAHHLRNSTSLQHQVGGVIADGASAALLLTATPIHLGNENLFNLFRVLDPDEFDDLATFESRVVANEPVVHAERLIVSAFPPPLSEVKAQVRELEQPRRARFFTNNPFFARLKTDIDIEGEVTRQDVVKIHQDLKDLNLLSHIFTRSRKREVFKASAVRQAKVRRPPITPEELRFYNAVTRFVRSLYSRETGNTAMFAASTAQRQVASSMQAAKQIFISRAIEELTSPDSSDLEDLFPDFDAALDSVQLSLPEQVIAAADGLGAIDTKYDALLDVMKELDREEPGRKIMLFAYFKDTLRYLSTRLKRDGYSCEVIHGDVTSDPRNPQKDERGQRMRRFREDPSIRVLLSSEVGSEGLDFQFCHILVNYDLPWNPMRVEQRIGRLDRLGQEAERILIFNLSLPHTIEDRILTRLYARIGIFERSIGDLEAIIGDEIHELTRELLSRHLSEEEEEELIERAATVIEQQKLMLDRLENEAARFIGADSYFEAQLERARTGGETLAPDDLQAFFERFLQQAYPKSSLRPTDEQGVLRLTVDSSLESDIRHGPANDSRKFKLLQRLSSTEGLRISFRSDRAYQDDRVELLGPTHPLMGLAVDHYRRHPEEIHAVSALKVAGSELPAGRFLYVLNEVQIQAGRLRKRLEPLFMSVENGEVLPSDMASRLLGAMLRDARRWDRVPAFKADEAREALARAEVLFLDRLATIRQDMQDRNEAVVQTRLSSLALAHERRMNKFRGLLDRAIENDRQESYIRMLSGQIRNREAEFEQRKLELEGERTVTTKSTLIGCGLVEVGAPQ
jgi:SNF2 family DNA or RNA helicase